jgi:predicted transcriptional regulator of viral defense system
MKRSYLNQVFELAELRDGYFSAAAAREAGIPGVELVKMAQRGVLERSSRGVYRIYRYPQSPYGQLHEATLWPRSREGAEGVLSHESALVFHGLSDVSPSKVHITLPWPHRTSRTPPPYLIVHRARIEPADVERRNGLLVTSARRSIADCIREGLLPSLVRQAIGQAQARGDLTAAEAAGLWRQAGQVSGG